MSRSAAKTSATAMRTVVVPESLSDLIGDIVVEEVKPYTIFVVVSAVVSVDVVVALIVEVVDDVEEVDVKTVVVEEEVVEEEVVVDVDDVVSIIQDSTLRVSYSVV